MGYYPEGNYTSNIFGNMYDRPSSSASAASSTPILDAACFTAHASPQATPSSTPTTTKPTFNFPMQQQSAFTSRRRQNRQRLGAHPFLPPTAGVAWPPVPICTGMPPCKRCKETGRTNYHEIGRVGGKDLKSVAEKAGDGKADGLVEMMMGLEVEKREDEEIGDVSAEEGTEEQK